MARGKAGRRVFNIARTKFQVYDLEGPVQPEMAVLPISYDRRSGQGAYVMRMDPGARTIAHRHPGMEEFIIIDGELIDSDGTVFRAGDFVSYQPGTRHNSWTDTGCMIAVFEWRPPAKGVGKPKPKPKAARRRSAAARGRRSPS
jgi:quercetin dioxygenase-like cupin family protein